MLVKKIFYNEHSRKILKEGMSVLNKSVALTLGPVGRNVVLVGRFGKPKIVNDGVTIAKDINLAGHLANIGVCLLRQASLKTNKVAGDGTTTAIVIAYSIVDEGLTNIALGANPIFLKKGIDRSLEFLVAKLNNYPRPVDCIAHISHVSFISSGAKSISSLITKAIRMVGRRGMIFVEEGNTVTDEIEIVEGLRFDEGFISGYFVTDKERLEVVLRDAYILLTDKKIVLVKNELIPVLDLVLKEKKALLIISDGFGVESLSTLIRNRLKGIINVVAVRVPGFGDSRKTFLSDLAVLTGGRVISSAVGDVLENISVKDFGRARRVVVGKESTTVVSDTNRKDVVLLCEQLKRQIMVTDSLYEKEKILERLANLSSGVALLRVGGLTETELKDRSLRLEDAVNATKSAIEEGIVPGGGITLTALSNQLFTWSKNELYGDELLGSLVVKTALNSPFKNIVSNAGRNGNVVLNRISAALTAAGPKHSFGVGYNVMTDEVVDMFDVGIVDPIKVTRSTLQNALSISSIVLTTECVMVSS